MVFQGVRQVSVEFTQYQSFGRFATGDLSRPHVFVFQISSSRVILQPTRRSAYRRLRGDGKFTRTNRTRRRADQNERRFSISRGRVFATNINTLVRSAKLRRFLHNGQRVSNNVRHRRDTLRHRPFLSG